MLGVAKGTMQVTAAEAHEDRWRSGVEAFALKGVKDFINLKHGRVGRLVKVLWRIVLDIGGLVIA